MSDVPQLILTGGPVLTMDPAAPEAEALAVRDGVITAVGAARDVLPLRGARTEVVDLTGQALLPGFVEAHGHPTIMGLAVAPPALDVRPFSVPTGRAVYERIRAAVAAAPGEPVAAYGIDLLLQRDLALPTRELLDSLSPHAPLVVISNSGHAARAAAATPGALRRRHGGPVPPCRRTRRASACSWTTSAGGEMSWRTTCSARRWPGAGWPYARPGTPAIASRSTTTASARPPTRSPASPPP